MALGFECVCVCLKGEGEGQCKYICKCGCGEGSVGYYEVLIMFYETTSWSMIKVICYTDRLSKTKTKSFGYLKNKLSLLFTKTRDLGHTNKKSVYNFAKITQYWYKCVYIE